MTTRRGITRRGIIVEKSFGSWRRPSNYTIVCILDHHHDLHNLKKPAGLGTGLQICFKGEIHNKPVFSTKQKNSSPPPSQCCGSSIEHRASGMAKGCMFAAFVDLKILWALFMVVHIMIRYGKIPFECQLKIQSTFGCIVFWPQLRKARVGSREWMLLWRGWRRLVSAVATP